MRIRLFFAFIIIPLVSFGQNAVIRNIYAIKSKDTVKIICYPFVNGTANRKINNTIKALVFDTKHYDTTKSIQTILQSMYKKDNQLKINYNVTYNKNGLLSLTVYLIPSNRDKKPPLYLNFDLNTGNLITISQMLKTKNDSFSFRQAVVPTITDSIRLFEQTIDKNNPKYSDIIEWLNVDLSKFREYYPSNYSFTDSKIIVYYNCFMPISLLPYYHTYQVSFYYKTLKNILKPGFVNRLN